jgi:hypothetical protein
MKTYYVLDLGNDNYLVLRGPSKIKNKLIIGKTYSGDELEKLGYELDKEEDLEERVWKAYPKNYS